MRHRRKSEKFSRSRAQRKALVKSLLRSFVISERITTTESKAKAMRIWADKLITWAKEDSLHNRRLSYRLLEDHALVKRLFDDIGPRFKDINGGYTRVIDLGFRKGDGAKVSILELTKIEKKDKKLKGKKARKTKKADEKTTTKDEKKTSQETKSQKGIVSRVRKIFNKEKGSH